MNRNLLACFLILLAGGLSCDLFDDDDPGKSIPFQNLQESEALAVLEPGVRVFIDDATWSAFWTAHSGTPVPPVDFADEIVAGVFWGTGFSGCSNRVDAVRKVARYSLRVEVDVAPLPDLGDCEMIVYPNQLVRFRRIDLPVVFTGSAPQ